MTLFNLSSAGIYTSASGRSCPIKRWQIRGSRKKRQVNFRCEGAHHEKELVLEEPALVLLPSAGNYVGGGWFRRSVHGIEWLISYGER
jgi:hypothetical protein